MDDNRPLLDLIRELLVDEGFEVFACRRAAEVQDLVRHVRPDLVLLDLCLNGEDQAGWQVLDQLTLDPATRGIPVVLCTGAAEAVERRRHALRPEYGLRVCPKPFDLGTLLRTMDELLDRPDERAASLEAADSARLTPREREVAALVAVGQTNAQIARELVLTEGTVANHVAHILGKLGFANRAQVAAWAAQRGLLAADGLSA